MEAPEFAKHLGPGEYNDTMWVLNVCPKCGGKKEMRLRGNGMWGCPGCGKGGKTLQSLREFWSTDTFCKQFVPLLQDPKNPEAIIVLSEYESPQQGRTIGTGFGELDKMMGGLGKGELTVFTGERGHGKSTALGQVSLNAYQMGHIVTFYSGELSAHRFKQWLYSQAAGEGHMESYIDQYGAIRYTVERETERKINEWIGKNILLYDNTYEKKSSERAKILDAFAKSREYFGSDLFVIDNLMTARYSMDSTEKDALRAQANFANAAMDFARTNGVHVILVAHPRKGEAININDSVAGLGDITNMATNVLQVKKADDKERTAYGCDSLITIAKNRNYGDTARFSFNFEPKSKRFIPVNGSCISTYGWQK